MKLLAAAPLALLLAACPYSSEWTLGDPAKAPMDSALVGEWNARDPESKQVVTITFLPYNTHELVAFSRDADDPHGKVDSYRAFVTVIDGVSFLNMQELGAQAAREWSYASYRIEGKTLSLRFVDDGLFGSRTFDSSEAFREFIRKNLKSPGLYVSDSGQDTLMKFTKAEKP